MKSLTFLVAVAGFLALMAVGASFAFGTADVLCKVKSEKEGGVPTSCPAESRHPAESKLGFEGSFKLENSGIGLREECSAAMMMENTAVSGEPLPIRIDKFELTKCSGSCPLTVVALPWKGKIPWTSGTWNGSLILEKSSLLSGLCLESFKCEWTVNETAIGELRGGNPAKVIANSVTIPRTGGSSLCGSSAVLNLNLEAPPEYYEVEGPRGIYVEPF
ncbi:MAG: hypothetical protein ACTHN3_06995 [Solirubrobacterales bacterium]